MKTKPLATILRPSDQPCFLTQETPSYLVRFADDSQLPLTVESIGEVLKQRGNHETAHGS